MPESHDAAPVPAELLSDAFESLAEGIAIYDAELRLIACNGRYRQMLAPIADIIVPGVPWAYLARACIARGVFVGIARPEGAWLAEAEHQIRTLARDILIEHADGRCFEVSCTATRTGGYVVTRADVTERRRAEEMVRDREALLGTILDTNPTPVVMARLEDSRIIYRSPAAAEAYGDTDHAADYYVSREDRAAYVAELRLSGRVQDHKLRARDVEGRERTVSLSGGLTEYGGETCVVSSITDLTERLEREALIRLVVESCPAPILMNRAASGEILFKSPELIALFGEGDNATDFYVDAADRAGFVEALRRTGEVIDYRARFRNARGEPIWCAISARLIQWGGEDVIVSHARDLTVQLSIEAELARQREQLFRNEKMSALGSLLAGVAHELNNPLSVVVGHALMLQDEAGDPDTLRKTRKISEAAERCSQIVRTFLAMARQEPARMEETDVNEVVGTAVDVARYGNSAHSVRIETDLDEGLPPICADRDQITQVVLNLILNAEQAIEASGTGDTVRVRTGAVGGADAVVVSVEDNGPGIAPDIQARVFEPFFTTKGVGNGTGVGLALCHRVVTAHAGRIEHGAVAPHGARFTVTLPRNRAAAGLPAAPVPSVAAPTATRVLVIDDERDVADLAVEMLDRAGFEAEAAYRAAEAFDRLRARSFDVVVSDLNMPGVDGRGVFEMIGAEFPALVSRTGFITGDTMGRASQAFLRESRRPYLEKPVSPRELREFVARLAAEGGVA